MNNLSFSKIWILIILIVVIAGGIFVWQYFGKPAETPKEAVNNFLNHRMKAESELYSYLPDYAETVELKVATILTSFSKIILTAPDLKKYDVAEAKEISPGKFQFTVKPYLVKEGKDLGYYEENIVMEKSGNGYIVTSFKQSEYKPLIEEDPCENLSSEAVTYGKYEFPSERDFCYWSLAGETKNLNFCNKIDDRLSKNECYAELGVINEDLTVCEAFEGDLWFSSKCYTGIAQKTKDATICEKIRDEGSKKACKDWVEFAIEKEELEEEYEGYEIELMANWKTYQNKKYGYEIKYPSKFTIEEKVDYVKEFFAPYGDTELPEGSVELLFPKDDFEGTKLYKAFVKISVADKLAQGQKLEKKKTVNGIEFWEEFSPDCGMGVCFIGKGYYAKRDSQYYEIMLWEHYTTRESPEYPLLIDFDEEKLLETLDKMLSTFKFIEIEEGLYIKVISPNGGEKWTAGKTYNITWESSGLEGKSANIYLFAYNQNKMEIVPKEEYRYKWNYLITENVSVIQEKFIWEIPADISQRFTQPPNYYKINISSPEELSSWGVKVENLNLSQSRTYFEISPD